jgi:hypothetical protein
MRVMQEDLARI